MGKLKRRKYLGILGILLLVVGIIFLFSYGKIDKYRGFCGKKAKTPIKYEEKEFF